MTIFQIVYFLFTFDFFARDGAFGREVLHNKSKKSQPGLRELTAEDPKDAEKQGKPFLCVLGVLCG